MANRNIKILFVSAEVAPFSSVGGLSQVSYFLPRALYKLGVDVRIFTPKYGTIDETKFPTRVLVHGLKVPTGQSKDLICNVKVFGEQKKSEPTVYLLENMEYFEKRANVYGYSDDHIRFGLLSRAALEFIKTEHFVPDLIHANDWHTGYLLNYLCETFKNDPLLKRIATVFSVHNLYQGNFDFKHASDLDFDDGKGELAPFFSDRFFKQNALKRGVISADLINTVSETHSREILTEEYGGGLENLFKELRGKLFGVLNGLDYTEFNPQTDKLIKKNYSVGNLNSRLEDKTDLQKEFGLNVDPNVPILAIEGRLSSQKGIDLVMETMQFVLDEFLVQFVVMGPGEQQYKDYFAGMEKKYPGRVGTHLMGNFSLPRKIFAGADIQLMPSRYEPGGIVAIEAMRYGCVPLVRTTGGLADSVIDFDPIKNSGTGFTFKNFSPMSFLAAVVRALETYKNKQHWKGIVKRAMQQDFSWESSAKKYLDLYSRALEFKKDSLSANPPMAFRQQVS